jgi:hypothetical protein
MVEREGVRAALQSLPDQELVDILAWRDETQWEPEVFGIAEEVLRGRGVAVEEAVAAARAAAGPAPDPESPATLVTVARYFTPVEAQLCRAHLEQAGLSPILVDENVAAMHYLLGVFAGGIRVQVPAAQAAQALEVLSQEAPAEMPELCPVCGSSEVTHEVRPDRAGSLSSGLIFGVPIGHNRHRTTCAACGYSSDK